VGQSTAVRANEEADVLFGTVNILFGTTDSGGMRSDEEKKHFAPPNAPAAVDRLENPEASAKHAPSRDLLIPFP
jgi:hypothetical protein